MLFKELSLEVNIFRRDFKFPMKRSFKCSLNSIPMSLLDIPSPAASIYSNIAGRPEDRSSIAGASSSTVASATTALTVTPAVVAVPPADQLPVRPQPLSFCQLELMIHRQPGAKPKRQPVVTQIYWENYSACHATSHPRKDRSS